MPGPLLLNVIDATVGTLLLGGGAVAWRLRPASRTGLLVVVTGLCWFAGSLVGPAVLLHRGPLVHLVLAYPRGRPRRPLAVAGVAVGYGSSVLVGVGRDAWGTFGVAGLLCVAAIDVFRHSSGPARKAGGTALAAAVCFAGALVLSSVRRLLDGGSDVPVLLVYDATVALVALILVVGLVRGAWTDAALADLVTDLGEEPNTDGLTGRLRQALGDASLTVGFWDADRSSYLDERGRPLELPAPDGRRAVMRVDGSGGPLAVLVHDTVLADDPRLVTGVASAARLAVTNVRLRGEVRHRVTELAESRRRLVDAADAESRRLRLRLERGAERRLAHVQELLEEAERAGGDRARVRAELDGARRELHEFAQGIRPAALDAGGLRSALPLLAARSPVPVDLIVDAGRLAPPMEAALFFFCSEALANVAKHARGTRATVDLRVDGDRVMVEVTDDGVGGADARGSGLRGLADRIEALGGGMTVTEAAGGGTRLVATIDLLRTPGGRER